MPAEIEGSRVALLVGGVLSPSFRLAKGMHTHPGQKKPHGGRWRGPLGRCGQALPRRTPKMRVGAQKDAAFDECGFGDNKGIIPFRNSLDDSMTDRNQVQWFQLPCREIHEGGTGSVSLAVRLAVLEQKGQLLKHRWEHNQSNAGNALLNRLECVDNDLHPERQVQKDIGINGDEHGPGNCPRRRRFVERLPAGWSVRRH